MSIYRNDDPPEEPEQIDSLDESVSAIFSRDQRHDMSRRRFARRIGENADRQGPTPTESHLLLSEQVEATWNVSAALWRIADLLEEKQK